MRPKSDAPPSSEFHPDIHLDTLAFLQARPVVQFYLGDLYEQVVCNLPQGLNYVSASNHRSVGGVEFFTLQMPLDTPDVLACVALNSGRVVVLHFAHITSECPVEIAIQRGLGRLASFDWNARRRVS